MKIVRIFLKNLFKNAGSLFYFLSRNVYRTDQDMRTILWYKNPKEKEVRFNFDLKEDSVVFDVGGYEGQWASDIFSMYACNVFVFEPVCQFSNKIKDRFQRNSKIKVFNFGLGARNEQKEIFVEGDKSSTHKGKKGDNIDIHDIFDFIENENLATIDLIKINIEGDEYDLIDRLISTNKISTIKNVLVQFHDFVPDAEARMLTTRENLSKTHKPVYQQEFVWERWAVK
jgi:FkbM family methyltransferase